ncbi:MAG: hypothetical protein U0573_02100 [Phycisphaerales bacterium]|nr:hypothetical protein [Planctomycetota bacterium]
MLRAISGVIVSYIVLAIAVMLGFAALWFAFGVDGMLEPGSFKPTMTLNIGAVATSALGAILGGAVCRAITRSAKPPMVLAGIVLVLGMIAAAVTIRKPQPGVRAPDLPVMEAIRQGREPDWFAICNPLIGAAGVIAGSAIAKRGRP